MTERLYYDDAYLTAFEATVTSCAPAEQGFFVKLDRSAFYPTSGGQPYDTGMIGAAKVLDVFVDGDQDVTHRVDRPLQVGDRVTCAIDWPRRFDHMQQHAGDHMIASALWRLLGGVTIGLHISEEVSTIDVAMPEGRTRITPEDIRRVEDDVNARIQQDVPICCWFPQPEELKALPLRKPPTVSEHVRVVAIGADEMVACGGTHPATAGQLGLVKILNVAPARGKMRVSFLAGGRALSDYQSLYALAHGAAAQLSTGVQNLPEHVAALQEALRQAEYDLGRLRLQSALDAIARADHPTRPDGTRVIARMLEGDMALVKDVAARLIKEPKTVALIGAEVEPGRAVFAFARSEDVDLHMGQILAQSARSLGGKGGGRPDFAQGGGAIEILEAAKSLLCESFADD